MSRPTDVERRFAEWLSKLAEEEDRAALAALRRGLGKPAGTAAEMQPYVARWLPETRSRRDDAYYLVAALFGLHPMRWTAGEKERGRTDLGASVLRLSQGDGAAGTERRFVALLNSHPDDLPEHLRHIVSLVKAHDIPVDWAQLLHDVLDWDRPERWVQRDWAREYWGGLTKDDGDVPDVEPETEEAGVAIGS